MLLHNGSFLAAHPLRMRGGQVSTNAYHYGRSEQRSRFVADVVSKLASDCSGSLHPGTWNMAQKPGMISAFTTTSFRVSANELTLAGGVNLESTGSISFSVPDAELQLIANLSGTSSITFSVPSATLGGAANISGTSSINFAVPDATLGGVANISSTASIVFSTSATIMGLAFLSGPAAEVGLTADEIANAVLDKFMAEEYPPASGGSTGPTAAEIAQAVYDKLVAENYPPSGSGSSLTATEISNAVYAKLITEEFQKKVWEVPSSQVTIPGTMGREIKGKISLIPASL
jgi:hypothetical protein